MIPEHDPYFMGDNFALLTCKQFRQYCGPVGAQCALLTMIASKPVDGLLLLASFFTTVSVRPIPTSATISFPSYKQHHTPFITLQDQLKTLYYVVAM